MIHTLFVKKKIYNLQIIKCLQFLLIQTEINVQGRQLKDIGINILV